VPQKTTGLRNPEGERVRYFGRVVPSAARDHRIRHPVAISELVAQEGDEVAGHGKAGAEHRGPGRLIPEIVNLVRRKMSAGWEQSDRLPVHKLPRLRRDDGTAVALAIAHRQMRIALVGRDGRVVQSHDIPLARCAGADMELVTDAAHHRLTVFECWRQPRRHSVIGARRPRIPTRPNEAVAAAKGEA